MKRAILVFGPESSGTRWMTGALMRGGAVGDSGHIQRWDDRWPEDDPLIVWRRSFPHGPHWPAPVPMIQGLEARGYTVRAVVMARDWYCVAQSQARFQPDAAIQSNIQRAYTSIFEALRTTGIPFVLVSYEALVQRPGEFGRWLVDWCGVAPVTLEATDGNTKYYDRAAV